VNKITKQTRSKIDVVKTGPACGAEVRGADLSRPLSAADFKTIHDALIEHEVIVLPDQQAITVEDQIRFGERFGELSVHPFSPHAEDVPELIVLDNDGDNPPLATDIWHSDETFRETPPWGTILRAKVVPQVGGNTVFASMTAAYEGLSDRMQAFLSGLEAVHDFKPFRRLFGRDAESKRIIRDMEDRFPNPVHPVVRVHPVSGKKAIFVNKQFTVAIRGMTERESDALLDVLYHLPEVPEYQFRAHWQVGMMVFWDNRSVQHYAPRDYLPQRRRMERVTLVGDKPFGPEDAMAEAGLVKKKRAVADVHDRKRYQRMGYGRDHRRPAKAK
jgi:taurine dioxygenase